VSKFVAAGETAFTAEHFSGRLPLFLAAAGVMVASGCSAIKPADSFTLLTELPPGFSIKGEASYVPRTGESCTVPAREGRNQPGKKFFKQDLKIEAQTARFEIPLISNEGGCPLVLKRFDYEVDAKYGRTRLNIGRDYAGISFVDKAISTSPITHQNTLQRNCQWLFRTAGPKNNISKILSCKAVAAPTTPEAIQRDELLGKSLTAIFSLAHEELPYMGDTWIKFPEGWKRCLGKSIEDPYGFCNGNTTNFKPFKMPDGRDCTVYPNCTEQGL
jgi:hypothetical protein